MEYQVKMSGERLLDMCVEQELVIGNSFFQEERDK